MNFITVSPFPTLTPFVVVVIVAVYFRFSSNFYQKGAICILGFSSREGSHCIIGRGRLFHTGYRIQSCCFFFYSVVGSRRHLYNVFHLSSTSYSTVKLFNNCTDFNIIVACSLLTRVWIASRLQRTPSMPTSQVRSLAVSTCFRRFVAVMTFTVEKRH